ncbi:MAG: PorT family protein [Prevotellaceae bacterium]|jgi:hypothetical protein|nr:PorT family protein [Prevotellaceae bacterium]
MKTFYIVTLWLVVAAGTARAQLVSDTKPGTPNRFNEYSVYASAGMSNILCKTDGGQTGYAFGYNAGLEYTCNIVSHLGISTGAEYSNFAGTFTRGSLGETCDAVDAAGTPFLYTYSMQRYEESQRMNILSIPLMLRAKFATGWYNKHIYIAGGVKLAIPLGSKVKISADNIHSSGYYPYENIRYENMPRRGFYNGLNVYDQQSAVRGFTTMVILCCEAGLRIGNPRNALYIGAYLDWLPADAGRSKSSHPMNYSGALSYESILNSALISDMKMMSAGLKVKFSLF